MKIGIAMCLVLLVTSTKVFAQHNKDYHVTDMLKAIVVGPGIGYEKATGKLQTLYGKAYMATSVAFGYNSFDGFYGGIGLNPALTVQYRYYYNYARREKKGKQTQMNNLNYIAPAFETVFSKNRISSSHYGEAHLRPVNTIGVLWGLQRNYPKRFSVDFDLGIGYLFTTATVPGPADEPVKKNYSELSPLAALNLGFWLNKKK